MTAHILAINKNGIALASDSAITWINPLGAIDSYTDGAIKAIKIRDNVVIAVCGNSSIANFNWLELLQDYLNSQDNIDHPRIHLYLTSFLRHCQRLFNFDETVTISGISTDFLVAGYAQNSMYPSYTFCNINGYSRNEFIRNLEPPREFENEEICNFVAFAQDQAAATIGNGIDPSIHYKLLEIMNANQIEALNTIIRQRHSQLIGALEFMSLDELSEVAKSGVITAAYYNFLIENNRTVNCNVKLIKIPPPNHDL